MSRRIDWISTFRFWVSCFRWIFPLAFLSVSDSLPTICASKSIQFKFHEFICQSLCMTNRHVYAFRFVFYEENNIQIAQLRWRNFFRCHSRFFYQKKNVVVTEGNFYVFYFITKWAKARVRYNCTCTGFDVDLNLSTHQIRHMAVNWKYHTFPSIDFASAFCVTAHWRDAIHSA